MPVIIQPGDNTNETPRLDLKAANTGSAGESLANIQTNFGKVIQDTAEEYFQKTDAIFKDTQYNSAVVEAQKEFNELYNERINNIRDKKGNLNIKDIPKDIEAIAEQVRQKHTRNIFDPEVSSRVSANLAHHTGNKGLEALNFAAKLQAEEAEKAAIERVNMAIVTEDIGAIKEATAAAVANGYMEPSAALSHVKRALREVETKQRVAASQAKKAAKEEQVLQNKAVKAQKKAELRSFSDAVAADPEEAKRVLEMSYEEATKAGLNLDTFDSMKKIAKAAVKDAEKDAAKLKKEQEEQIKEKQKAVKTELSIGLHKSKGTTTLAMIETQYQNKNISPDQYETLLGEYEASINKENKETKKQASIEVKDAKINEVLAKGESTTLNFSSADISNRIDRDAKVLAGKDENGNQLNPTIEQLSKAASPFVEHAYKPLAKRMGDSIRYAKPESAKEVIDAFDDVAEANPVTVQSMPNEDIAAIAMFKNLHMLGADPEEALEKTREVVYKSKEPNKLIRQEALSKVKELKPENIKSTIIDTFGLSKYTRFGSASLEPALEEVLGDALKSAFIEGDGSLETAKKVVQVKYGALVGVSEINETKGYINDMEQFMYLPPEKVYSKFVLKNGVQPIRDQLENDFKDDLPEGVEPSALRIRGDYLSRPQDVTAHQNQEDYDWAVYYVDPELGMEIPLTEKGTGRAIRFSFDPIRYKKEKDEREKALADLPYIGGKSLPGGVTIYD